MSNPFEDLIGQRKTPNPFEDLVAPAEEQPLDVDFDFGTMVRNVPSSAGRLVGDLFHAVTNPIDTATSVAKLGGSALNKGQRKVAELVAGTEEAPGSYGDEQMADAAWQALKDRYGGVEQIQRTLMEDPVGAALDFSGAGAMAGRVAGAGRLARGAAALNPTAVGGKAVRQAAKSLTPNDMPRSMYESAAKFSTTIDPAKRAKMTQTALDQKLLPTAKGVDKLKSRVAELDTMVDDMIDAAGKANAQIPVAAVYSRLGDLMKAKSGFRLGAESDVAAIQKIAGDLHRSMRGKSHVTPAELQKFKREAYKDINWDAKRNTGTPIKEETYKAMARSARESLEEHVPGLDKVNKEFGSLLELEPHLTRSANRIDNLNLMGLSGPMRTGAGAVIGEQAGMGGLGAAAGAVAAIADNPLMKARAAIILNKIKQQDIKWLSGNATRAEIEAALAWGARNEELQQEVE